MSSSQRDDDAVRVRAEAARAAELALAAAAAARRAAGASGRAVSDAVAEAAARSEALQSAVASALDAAEHAAERTRVLVERLPATQVVEGVLEDASAVLGTAVERGSDAWDALRGRRQRRRWPWAAGAAVAGAAAGVGAALLVRALRHEDPPGAQDPTQVRAVVDTGGPAADAAVAPVPAERLDEDGEAVQP